MSEASPPPRVDDDCSDTMLEVTITVLSLGGVVAKQSNKSTMKRKKQGRLTPATTSLVASFCQAFTSDGRMMHQTHVPSIPLDLEHLDASCMSSKSRPAPQPIVHWPGVSHDDDDNANQVLSTLRFVRRFDREDAESSQGRFIPQTCPISISISRHGHLIGLGKADVIIVGEENGVSSMVVPVSSFKKVSRRSKSSTPMMKIKGDDLKFGLKSDAMLRVLVSVSKVQTPEIEVIDQCSDPIPGPQSVVCDNATTEAGSNCNEQVNAREEMHITESNEIKPRPRRRVRSTTALRGSLFGEEPEGQQPEQAAANDIQNVDTAETEAEDIIPDPDCLELDETTTSLNVVVPSETDANKNRDVDTTLSFCVLGAILGSPAPSCVKKHGRKTASSIFWDLEDGIEDDIPDLRDDNSSSEDTDPSNEKESGLNDTFTTASLSDCDESHGASVNNEEELIDVDTVPDIDIVDETCDYECPAFDETSIKKAADSALAWSALALILHSPAPAAVTKLGSSCIPKHSDDQHFEDALFTIEEVEEEVDDIPSLADTAESPPCTPKRKQREYMFKDSLDDNAFLPELESMANQMVEQCPHCKLLYCQEFPCSTRCMIERDGNVTERQPYSTYKDALMKGNV